MHHVFSTLRPSFRAFSGVAAALVLAAWVLPAHASKPSSWHFADGADFAKGKLDGLSLHPTLGLTIAPELQRVEVPADFIHCWVRDGDKLWVGTGLQAKLFLVTGGKVREVAQLEGALVGALAIDGAGGVYAGLVGHSKIVHVTSAGKVTDVVKFEDAKHVWTLLRHGRRLYAGTGPGGVIYDVDPATKKATVHAKTDTEHVLDLLYDKDGLVAATADPAMLVRVGVDRKALAIAGFPGGEVRSIARLGDTIYAVVNGGSAATKLTRLKATPDRPGKTKAKKPTKATKKKEHNRTALGKGSVWSRTDDGRVTRLFISPEGMLSQIGAAGQGVAVGAARGGRVVIGDMDGEVESLFDLKEEQVLGLEMGPKGPKTLFTGKGAAVYYAGERAKNPVYTSHVLREVGVARWGRIAIGGTGKLVVETRSGFSDPPNDTWTEWAGLANGRVQSAPARFLQFRVLFKSSNANLTEVRIHRQLFNRKPTLGPVTIKHDPVKKVYRVSWQGKDYDGDTLGYVVTYRKRATKQWLMLHDRYFLKNSMAISPRDMPDGWYEIRVQASDSLSNSPTETLQTARISKPFLVDQGRPEVAGEVRDGKLNGVAADRVSNIVRVEVSFDGEPSVLATCGDGVFDGLQEAFELKLPKDLQLGRHTLLIQATDEAGNTGVQRLTVGP